MYGCVVGFYVYNLIMQSSQLPIVHVVVTQCDYRNALNITGNSTVG